MEVESLSDVDLRKMLIEYGVTAGPVTDTTRNVLQNTLSKVMSSETSVHGEHRMESYTVEEVVNTTSCMVSDGDSQTPEDYSQSYNTEIQSRSCMVTDGDSQTSEEYSQSYNTEIQTPSQYEHTLADLVQNEDSESYLSRSYEYTPTSQTLRYARDSYPCSDNLKRRPLNTSRVQGTVEHTSTKIEKTTHLVTPDPGKTCTKKKWVCSRVFIILLLLVIFFVLLVYYHMEHNDVKSLPDAIPVSAVKNSPVDNQTSSTHTIRNA